jgi:hypothetical protein
MASCRRQIVIRTTLSIDSREGPPALKTTVLLLMTLLIKARVPEAGPAARAAGGDQLAGSIWSTQLGIDRSGAAREATEASE